MNTIPITMPSGEISILTIITPEKSLEKFVKNKCKFHIPLNSLDDNLQNNRWPHPKLLEKPPKEKGIPPEKIWTGEKSHWESLHKEDTLIKSAALKQKTYDIKNTQQMFNKINTNEWESLTRLFAFHPQT